MSGPNDLAPADLVGDYDGRRVLKHVDLPAEFGALAGKRVYYYNVITVAERRAARNHVRRDPSNGTVYIDEEGIVDGLMARLRTSDGGRLFPAQYKRELMERIDADHLAWLWNAIGGTGGEAAEVTLEDAEKN